MKATFDHLKQTMQLLATATHEPFDHERLIENGPITQGAPIDKVMDDLETPFIILVSPNEVCHEHGTGVLLSRLFEQRQDVLSVRAHSHYKSQVISRSLLLDAATQGLQEMCRRVLQAAGSKKAKFVFVVPYFAEDVELALALQEIFQVPCITWVMDDNCIYSAGIPQIRMKRLLQNSALNFAISPQLKNLYQSVFNEPLYILPPVVNHGLVDDGARFLPAPDSIKPALVGNIWDARWFELLNQMCLETEISVDWFVANEKPPWFHEVNITPENLRIRYQGALPERELAERLREYTCVILPTAEDSERSPLTPVAMFSLPTKLPFVLACASIPLVVLGSNKSCVAKVVTTLGVGVVSDYDTEQFQAALAKVQDPEQRRHLHREARKVAEQFSDEGLYDWLEASLVLGRPVSDRFSSVFNTFTAQGHSYVEPRHPRVYVGDLGLAYGALQRLQCLGIQPKWVLDIGASSGIWADMCNDVFPDANYMLFEPLINSYNNDWCRQKHQRFEFIPVAVGDCDGKIQFKVSEDLFGSSLLNVEDGRCYEEMMVDIARLDTIFRTKNVSGSVLVKIDVQCAEHLVLAGAKNVLKYIDVIFIELSLERLAPDAQTFWEISRMLESSGYLYWDEVGGYRHSETGVLIQKDCVFLRRGLIERPKGF